MVFFFPDMSDELTAEVGNWRVVQNWDEHNEVWKLPGKWLSLRQI